jgi:DNA-binding response OmpR family regulator
MKEASKRRALLVDDDPELTELLAKALAAMGIEIETAIDGGDALRHLRTSRFDLVCTNLGLPRESGYELCEFIRAKRSLDDLLILVMSDRHSPEEIAYAEEAGANGFLRLPCSSSVLPSCIDALFDGRARSQPPLRKLRASEIPAPIRIPISP